MKRKLFSLATACLFCVFASAQTVYYVKTSGSDNNDGKSEGNAFKTIEKAVSMTAENTPTVIYLGANETFSFDGIWPEGYAYIDFGNNKKVEVIGNNTTVMGSSKPGNQGGQSSRIMRGGAGTTMKISGVNFVNGRQIEYMLGGAIYFGGEKLEVVNCKFLNNEAGSAGAAIGSRGKQLIVDNCYFEGNYTIGDGAIGATIMHCGVKQDAPAADSFLKVSNSTFYKNSMTSLSRGPAIGVYDPSSSGKYTCTLSNIDVTNCTFYENSISGSTYEGVIDLDGADEVMVNIINNTFHNNLAAISIPFFLGEINFINNVVYANETTIVSTVDQAYRTFTAYNNILLGGVVGVQDKMTEPSLNAQAAQYNNTVATTNTMPLSELALSPELVNGQLIITSESSKLVNAGMDDSGSITGTNLIPTTDGRGFLPYGKKDIGAYEYNGINGGTNINTEAAEAKRFFEMTYTQDGVTVKNISDNELTLRVISIDGKQIYATSFDSEVSINKNEISKGFVVFVLTDGVNTQSEKVVF